MHAVSDRSWSVGRAEGCAHALRHCREWSAAPLLRAHALSSNVIHCIGWARSLSGEQGGVQIGFYDFIVKGMYQSWGEFLPVCGGTVCSHGSENRERWVKRKETDAALAKGA